MGATRKHGKADYLFRRGDVWQVKLQSPDGRKEISLRTTDRAQAEIIALPLIAEHKAKLAARKPAFVRGWQHALRPGRKHPGPDGGEIIATERELIYLDASGVTVKTLPNGGPTIALTGGPLTIQGLAHAALESDAFGDGPSVRPGPITRNGDDEIIETYLKHANVQGYGVREARASWQMFRELCPGVKLANATRDDGRKLVAHLQAKGLRSASVEKKIGWLCAAVNLAIREGKLKFNPFSSIVPKSDDAQRRLPFDDADMTLIRDNLDKLAPRDQLLVRVLATTGIRLGEAFQIDGEQIERGIRFVIVGTKTEASLRRVPLSADLLPHVRAIKGVLFPTDKPHLASYRLMKWLRAIGIKDPAKVCHSWRHRAADRLRAAECPSDIRHALLGHEDRSVAESYGAGFAVPVLKKWIDKIGF